MLCLSKVQFRANFDAAFSFDGTDIGEHLEGHCCGGWNDFLWLPMDGWERVMAKSPGLASRAVGQVSMCLPMMAK